LVALLLIKIEPSVTLAIAAMMGAILPDIDLPTSKIGKKVKIGYLLEHRGFFHSLFAPILFSAIIYMFFRKEIAIAFFFGYLSHIVLDALNYKGIMPFAPLNRWKIKGFVKSGGVIDFVLFVIIVAVDITLLYF